MCEPVKSRKSYDRRRNDVNNCADSGGTLRPFIVIIMPTSVMMCNPIPCVCHVLTSGRQRAAALHSITAGTLLARARQCGSLRMHFCIARGLAPELKLGGKSQHRSISFAWAKGDSGSSCDQGRGTWRVHPSQPSWKPRHTLQVGAWTREATQLTATLDLTFGSMACKLETSARLTTAEASSRASVPSKAAGCSLTHGSHSGIRAVSADLNPKQSTTELAR